MKKTWKNIVLLMLAALWMLCATAGAEGASGDNSLYSLGLENASSCTPDFYYSTLEYNVTVPTGTEELYLSPVTSDSYASILDISGTVLDESGKGTVYITVEAPNGAQVSYVLYVSSEGAAESETEESTTESAEAKEAAREAELKAQAESEEALRREAELQSKEEQITKLSTENEQIVDRMNLLLKVLYGLVAFAVILLFFIINQSLRNKDLKDDLKEARMEAGDSYEFARKEQNMRTDYYYAPVNSMPQNTMRGVKNQSADANNMQAVFGNVPQRTPAQQPMQQTPPQTAPQQMAPQQMTPPQAAPQPMQQAYVPMQEQEMRGEEPQYTEKELRKMEKAEKKAAKKAEKEGRKAPVQQPAQPQMQDTYVQATLEEPDVDVDMIEL